MRKHTFIGSLMNEWSSIIFTDDLKIQNLPYIYGLWMENETQNPSKSRAVSVSAWGSITINGQGTLILVTNNMNGEQHKKIIKRNTLSCHSDGFVLLQDNWQYHSHSSVYFQEKRYSVLDWPSHSTDIKLHSGYMEPYGSKISWKARDKSGLFQETRSECEEIHRYLIFNYYQSSMPYYMLDILMSKSDQISY